MPVDEIKVGSGAGMGIDEQPSEYERPQQMGKCDRCGRSFNLDRLEIHMRVCSGPRESIVGGAVGKQKVVNMKKPSQGKKRGKSPAAGRGGRGGRSNQGRGGRFNMPFKGAAEIRVQQALQLWRCAHQRDLPSEDQVAFG